MPLAPDSDTIITRHTAPPHSHAARHDAQLFQHAISACVRHGHDLAWCSTITSSRHTISTCLRYGNYLAWCLNSSTTFRKSVTVNKACSLSSKIFRDDCGTTMSVRSSYFVNQSFTFGCRGTERKASTDAHITFTAHHIFVNQSFTLACIRATISSSLL